MMSDDEHEDLLEVDEITKPTDILVQPDTVVVDTDPVIARAHTPRSTPRITDDPVVLVDAVTRSERHAVAAGIAQMVAEQARDRAENEVGQAAVLAQLNNERLIAALAERDQLAAIARQHAEDVDALWTALGSVLKLVDRGGFMSAADQRTYRSARDLHSEWKMIDAPDATPEVREWPEQQNSKP